MDKQIKRKELWQKLNQLTEHETKSRRICITLEQWLQHYQPKQLGAFVPVKKEPNIWPVLLNFAKTNALYLPKFNPHTEAYDWAIYKEPLQSSKFNIPEPTMACNTPPSLDACLVPALGIDPNGNRIGWGHGYFDRLLNTDIPHRIGIIFECQLI